MNWLQQIWSFLMYTEKVSIYKLCCKQFITTGKLHCRQTCIGRCNKNWNKIAFLEAAHVTRMFKNTKCLIRPRHVTELCLNNFHIPRCQSLFLLDSRLCLWSLLVWANIIFKDGIYGLQVLLSGIGLAKIPIIDLYSCHGLFAWIFLDGVLDTVWKVMRVWMRKSKSLGVHLAAKLARNVQARPPPPFLSASHKHMALVNSLASLSGMPG